MSNTFLLCLITNNNFLCYTNLASKYIESSLVAAHACYDGNGRPVALDQLQTSFEEIAYNVGVM